MDRYFGRLLTEQLSFYDAASPQDQLPQKQNNKRRQRIQHRQKHLTPQQQSTSERGHQGGNRPSNKAQWTAGAKTLPDGRARPEFVPDPNVPERCAIGFWGLPRAFKSLVLPTLVENVLKPNAAYHCDVFVHYHYLEQEAPSRSGHGGKLNPMEIFNLTQAVQQVARGTKGGDVYEPAVRYTKTTEEDFFERRGEFINKTRYTLDAKGRYKYFPWKEKSFQYPKTTDNVSQCSGSIHRMPARRLTHRYYSRLFRLFACGMALMLCTSL